MSDPIPRCNRHVEFTELSANALRYAQEVLSSWGYLNPSVGGAPEARASPAITEALTEYTFTWGRRERFDFSDRISIRYIFDLLQSRLCGVPDPGHGGLHVTAYGSPSSRWSRGNLTYNVNVSGSGLTQTFVDNIVRAAFQQWAIIARFFTFRQVAGNADIQIQFGGSSLDSNFGRPGGVAAVGAYPEQGRLFFDMSESWSTGNLLLSVTLHEIGHVLGLSHSTSRLSLMYPYDLSLTTLDSETVQAIQSMYGWQPQIRLNDRGSVEAPSLAVAGAWSLDTRDLGGLYMAWRGVSGDDGIYWSAFEGSGWSPQENISGIGSLHGPALATGVTRNRADGVPVTGLFMAWDGVPGDNAIYFAQNPGLSGWTGQRRIDGVGTSDRPALALFNGSMRMTWKGVSGDSAIYWSTFDGNGWAPQQQIRGRGTTHGPALAVLGTRLYMFWKGVDGDSRVFYAWIDDQPGAIWQAQREVVYTDSDSQGNVHLNIGSSHRPAAAVRGNSTVLAWKGVPGDSGLWFAPLLNDEWSGQINVSGVGSSAGPAVATLNGALYMAWKGVPGDTALYYSRLG
jgi:Matrixin